MDLGHMYKMVLRVGVQKEMKNIIGEGWYYQRGLSTQLNLLTSPSHVFHLSFFILFLLLFFCGRQHAYKPTPKHMRQLTT